MIVFKDLKKIEKKESMKNIVKRVLNNKDIRI